MTAPGSPLEALRRAGQQAGLPDFLPILHPEWTPSVPFLHMDSADAVSHWAAHGELEPVGGEWAQGTLRCRFALTHTMAVPQFVVVAWLVEATP